jgi:hypothetical protein
MFKSHKSWKIKRIIEIIFGGDNSHSYTAYNEQLSTAGVHKSRQPHSHCSKILHGVAYYLLALNMELVSCPHSGAYSSEVEPRFLKSVHPYYTVLSDNKSCTNVKGWSVLPQLTCLHNLWHQRQIKPYVRDTQNESMRIVA